MKRVSVNLASAVLAIILIMLCTATAPVLGRMPEGSSEKMALTREYEVIVEEVASIRAGVENGNKKTMTYKITMKKQQPNSDGHGFEGIKTALLKSDADPNLTACVTQGGYCNPTFGIVCCDVSACVSAFPAGGVCLW